MTAQGPMPNRRAALAEAERRGEPVAYTDAFGGEQWVIAAGTVYPSREKAAAALAAGGESRVLAPGPGGGWLEVHFDGYHAAFSLDERGAELLESVDFTKGAPNWRDAGVCDPVRGEDPGLQSAIRRVLHSQLPNTAEGGARDPRLTEGRRWVNDVLDTWDDGDPASDRAAAEGLLAALNDLLA